MARASHKEKILSSGLKLVHAHGFGAASVRDIVQAAGVPQGSFTNHFASKEVFGLEILDLYFANSRQTIANTLLNEKLTPLKRLKAYVDANRDHIQESEMRNGCLFGNFSAEVVDYSESIRLRLTEIFAEVRGAVQVCLKAAVDVKEIDAKTDTQSMAGFIVSSLQGAILIAKAERTPDAVNRFEELLFSTMLR